MALRRSRPLLEEMLAYAEEAIGLARGVNVERLAAERMRFLALCKVVEVVGEAASQVPAEVRAAVSAIPFARAVSMRNRLVHGYGSISAAILADTVQHDFPPLVEALRQVLAGALPDDRP